MLGEAFSIQRRVVYALFLRELKTRFGKFRLGYLWVFLEPLAHMLVLFVVLHLLARHEMPNISFTVFLLCGLVPYFMFTGIALRSLNALEANLGLLSYRPVHPVDTLIARAMLEFIISFVVFATLLTVLWLAGEDIVLNDIPQFIAIWLLLGILAWSVGLICLVVGHEFPLSEKLIPMLIRPLYFSSSVMYSLSNIPAELRGWILWNPLLHALELLRHTVVPTYSADDVSLGYLAFSTLVTLFVSLALYKAREPALLRS